MLKWLKLRSIGFWGGFILMVRIVGGLGMQKFIAIFYGPAGTTLFSHFQNLISLFTQPIQDVVSQGLINAYPKEHFPKNKLLPTALAFAGFIFLTTLLLLLLLGAFPVDLFQFTPQDWLLILAELFLLGLQSIASALMIARKKLKQLGFLHFFQWVLIFSILLLERESTFHKTLLYFISIQGVWTTVFYLMIFNEIRKILPLSFKWDSAILTHFTQFLWMGLAVWLSSKWVDYFIREYAISHFGPVATGYWQAIVRISEAYRGLFISFLFLTFYPAISNILESRLPDVKNYFKRKYKLLMSGAILFFILIFDFNESIIELLFSEAYVVASSLFKLQIVGDLLAFLSFPFAVVLMAAVKTRNYILCELSSAVIFVATVVAGGSLGTEVLVYAHIVRFVLYLSLVIYFTRKILKIG